MIKLQEKLLYQSENSESCIHGRKLTRNGNVLDVRELYDRDLDFLRAQGHLELSEEDERIYGDRLQKAREIGERDEDAEYRLISGTLLLVKHIAGVYNKMLGGGLLEDLIGDGNLGLVQAVRGNFNGKDGRFGTYAAKCIRNAIRRRTLLEEKDRVGIPEYSVDMLKRASELEESLGFQGFYTDPNALFELLKAEGRIPMNGERTAISQIFFRKMLEVYKRSTVKLNDQFIIAKEESPVDNVGKEEIFGIVTENLDSVQSKNDREGYTLRRLFGDQAKQIEVARELSVSHTTVQNYRRRGLAKLKENIYYLEGAV